MRGRRYDKADPRNLHEPSRSKITGRRGNKREPMDPYKSRWTGRWHKKAEPTASCAPRGKMTGRWQGKPQTHGVVRGAGMKEIRWTDDDHSLYYDRKYVGPLPHSNIFRNTEHSTADKLEQVNTVINDSRTYENRESFILSDRVSTKNIDLKNMWHPSTLNKSNENARPSSA